MTGKELAKLLGVSEATVSYALNNKPGVSTEMRNRIKKAAQEYGIDVPEKPDYTNKKHTVYLLYYQKGEYNVAQNEFGTEVGSGVELACRRRGYPVHIMHIRGRNNFQTQVQEISNLDNCGIILFGTELTEEDLPAKESCHVPLVLLDNHFSSFVCDSVEISNEDSAFIATDYLIKKRHEKPGYLMSHIRFANFEKRLVGFKRALTINGYSRSAYISHNLTPVVNSAYEEMLEIINSGEPLASCYFAENDFIALGAIRALQEKNYRIPEDVGIIGFDDIFLSQYAQPGLTTVHVPKQYFGITAAERLFSLFERHDQYPVNIQISTNLVVRGSV